MARYKADTISQLMRHDYHIRVLCRCGNNATLSPEKLLAGRKVGLATSIDDLFSILSCKLCKARPYDVHATIKPEK